MAPFPGRTTLNATWVSISDVYVFGQGFQGGFVDSATGLILFQRRLYSPALGRWLQQDPAGYVDGANLYQMEGSNPVNAVDPGGLWTIASPATPGMHEEITQLGIKGAKITASPEYVRGLMDGCIYPDTMKELSNLSPFPAYTRILGVEVGGIGKRAWDRITEVGRETASHHRLQARRE